MPIYEYECDGCHSVFEVRQKVSDPAPQEHSCGSTQVRRILSATSFVLKGTGWYATDYGNRKDAPQDKAGSGPKADSTSSEAKSDTVKPEHGKAAPKAAGSEAKAPAGAPKVAKP